jgi:hypothetical protein
MHVITHTLGVHRRPPIAPPRAVTVEARPNYIRHITERNMGQSLYLCSNSAGFCCWGLGKGRPFPHVKAWGGTAQITEQGHRGTFFRVVFRYLAIAALSFSRRAIRLREDHSDGKITHHEVGWSPVRNHPVYVRGGQVSDWEESRELSAALQ